MLLLNTFHSLINPVSSSFLCVDNLFLGKVKLLSRVRLFVTSLTVLWFSTGQTSKIVVTEIYSKSVFIPFIILFPNRLVTSTAIKIAPALKNLMYLLIYLGLP